MIDNVNSHCVSLNHALYPEPEHKFAKESSHCCAQKDPPHEAFPSIHVPPNAPLELGEKESGKGKAYSTGVRGPFADLK